MRWQAISAGCSTSTMSTERPCSSSIRIPENWWTRTGSVLVHKTGRALGKVQDRSQEPLILKEATDR